MKIYELMRQYRIENGYTQQNVADIAKIGRTTVNHFEKGRRISLKIFIIYLKFILTKEQCHEVIEVLKNEEIPK